MTNDSWLLRIYLAILIPLILWAAHLYDVGDDRAWLGLPCAIAAMYCWRKLVSRKRIIRQYGSIESAHARIEQLKREVDAEEGIRARSVQHESSPAKVVTQRA